ncbi:Folylpolyglutamate synthase [Daphnia sinensis]|uniref:tetrahydrofolate synthase n=1 Tax=Daphnia sinensis TaxID=1820382 RepID=A0AAD5KE08_9CRUS|nr:Folylpolyglutamate synthase [Daphnia sinensis]
MTYKETIQYLYSRLPMFSREGKAAIKHGLDNIIKLCEKLDNPQNKFKSIHVGGTNGKGSTSHMLAAVLQTAGYKTGLYTSPHLRDFRERIRINGEMISEKEVIQFVQSNQLIIEELEPSFFEVTVAMAFEYFAKQEVDFAIIEVGLGGRLDSTNIIIPELSVISNIGYDHMNILGNTLKEIASEKAGIIKANRPVIISQKQSEIQDVFIKKASEMHATITFASDEWEITRSKTQENSTSLLKVDIKAKNQILSFKFNQLDLDLSGSYQLKNLGGVLSSLERLKTLGYHIDDQDIISALGRVKSLTGLMGRWQTLSAKPLVICDTGHNEDGIKEVLKNIELSTFKNLHMVIGMVKDKDISKILGLLPKDAQYYFCQPDIPRAKSAIELYSEAMQFNLIGNYYESVELALNAAKKNATEEDLIFIGGSTFVVAEIV